MAAQRYEIYLQVLKNISRVSTANEWNIFLHEKINFLSPRGHVISSISLPSPPPEIQVKNKIETGDSSGYTLEFTDTLIHWIISMQRKLTFFPNYNSGRNHWILNSIDINRTQSFTTLLSKIKLLPFHQTRKETVSSVRQW